MAVFRGMGWDFEAHNRLVRAFEGLALTIAFRVLWLFAGLADCLEQRDSRNDGHGH